MIDITEDRKTWYDKADKWELDFIDRYGEKLGIMINPSKEKDPYAPDLFILKTSQSADLKLLKTPFYTSETKFNIPPQYCWTFNPSDLFDYSVRYPNSFGLFIWKCFELSTDYDTEIKQEESLHYITLFDLKRMIIKSGRIHHYIRRMNDTNGNSFGSYGIDLRKLTTIKI